MVRVVNDPVATANRLRPVLLRLARELRREIHSLGVTGGQVSLLSQVKHDPGITASELAERERVSAPAMSGHLARLEAANLIERRRAVDRRRIGLFLTSEGAKVLRSVRSKRTAWLSARLDRLEPHERERIEDATRRPGEVDRRVTLLRIASRRTFASLRHHRNYRLFFAGQLTSVAGTWMQNIALAWVVVHSDALPRPRSRPALGLPLRPVYRASAWFAGVVTDRFDNRRTVIVTQTVQMVFSAVLAVLALAGHLSCGRSTRSRRSPGRRSCFDAPSRQNLTFQMVGKDELPNAVALNSSLFNLARIFGPALAGVLIAAVGVGWCFAINAVSFLAVLAALLAMRAADLFPLTGRRRPTFWRGRARASRTRVTNRTVQVTLSMMVVFASLCFNFNILLPLLAKNTLDAGPRTFGIISAAFGAGALVGALSAAAVANARWRTMLARRRRVRRLRAADRAGPRRRRGLVLLFACGVFFTSYTANSNASIQLASPDHLRGRVLGLYYYAWNGLAPLGGTDRRLALRPGRHRARPLRRRDLRTRDDGLRRGGDHSTSTAASRLLRNDRPALVSERFRPDT